jgi:DNA-binding response OmpR family regulator
MLRRILIVEDELDIARLVEMYLLDLGYSVTIETTGSGGLKRAESETFSLIILDRKLPGFSGLDICRRLRNAQNTVPILMLTAHASEADRIRGLEEGADDYVIKPFSIMELVARVKTVLRRYDVAGAAAHRDVIQLKDLSIDLMRHQVAVDGKRVELTAKEFSLLTFFAKNPGRIFSRAQLMDKVWGFGYDGYDHTVHSHINRLRTKIEADPAKPQRILTVRNVGYKFHDQAVMGA